MSKIHDIPSNEKIAINRLFIVLTILFWVIYVISVVYRQFIEVTGSYQFRIEAYGYLVVVTLLTFSALMYLIARLGALQAFSKHVRVPRAVLDNHFSTNKSSITVMIPSYDEEPNVVRKTLLSAALQEFPEVRVVLLIDDNVGKLEGDQLKKYKTTVELIPEINKLLDEPYRYLRNNKDKFKRKHQNRASVTEEGIEDIAKQYKWAAKWLTSFAESYDIQDHTDVFFADYVVKELAGDLEMVSEALLMSKSKKAKLSTSKGLELYDRIVRLFQADLSYFERKKYSSLSKEANKAMNLNSYIGLMGGCYKKETTPDGIVLVKTKSGKDADLEIPDSEFLLTLDADSILLPEYCLRLVYLLQQPDKQDVGVTQTPYSSFRAAPTRIERLAGASTDIQHIIHQGMSHYGAAFWVGANAVIRKKH